MASSKTSALLPVLAFLAFILLGQCVSGQQPPACASKLVPCANYINSTNPPSSCCDPLRDAVTNELPCLCNLFRNPGVFASFRINLTQALELPKHCGIASGIDACNRAPPPTAGAPPGTAGGDGTNNAGKVGISGLPGLLVLMWAAIVA